MLQLLFHIYPPSQSSGQGFVLWHSTAADSGRPQWCLAGTGRPLLEESPPPGTRGAVTLLPKKATETKAKETPQKKSKSCGGLQHMQCHRAPQGCSCFPNVERSTEAGWQAEPILFKPASSVTVHLKTFNRHFSSLTSALLQETKAALLIPCLQFSQAGWGLNNCMGFKDCRSPAGGCCHFRGGGDTAEIALGMCTWGAAPSCLRTACLTAERGQGPAPGAGTCPLPGAVGEKSGFAGWKINVFS